MTNIPLFPRPVSWLSAVLLYVFLGLWLAFLSQVAPRLYELVETSPRLAALGFLALWTSPIVFVGLGHHLVHAILDRAVREARVARSLPGSVASGRAFTPVARRPASTPLRGSSLLPSSTTSSAR